MAFITNKRKIINDPVYGFINIPGDFIFDVIEHPWFQRLRNIRQLGLTSFVYPGAVHRRFQHCLGALHLMDLALKTLKSKGVAISPEEEEAAQFTKRILSNTVYEKWVPSINQALLSLYREEEEIRDIGRAVYDADRLDKLGYMGVAQFFAKNALRRHFLDDDMMIRASIELTYAHHAQDTLKTATGRALAGPIRSSRRRITLTGWSKGRCAWNTPRQRPKQSGARP